MNLTSGITELLRQLPFHQTGAPDELFNAVFVELRLVASAEMRHQDARHTLQVTALVNESVLRILRAGPREWNNRKHFFAFAACVMRRILVDHARRRKLRMNGGFAADANQLDEQVRTMESDSGDLEALNTALEALAVFSPSCAQVVELRFFLGLSMDSTADALNIPKRSAEREWAIARAWLFKELRGEA